MAAAHPLLACNPCQLVRETAAWVTEHAELVDVTGDAVQAAVYALDEAQLHKIASLKANFDAELHFCDAARPDLTAQYLLTVDALNFCFWPEEGLEYEQLAGGIKAALLADPHILDASRLAGADVALVRLLFSRWPREVPLEQVERARLLRELGAGLLQSFDGQAAQLVRAAGGSAVRLVSLIAAQFPGFRDHCTWGGRQVFFYKRAQIFVGDLWGAFGGCGLGEFSDIDQLTMFADYRVPAVLREMGVLRYHPSLEQHIDSRQELLPGGREEIEIRAATIVAVEQLRAGLQRRLQRLQHGRQASGVAGRAGGAGNGSAVELEAAEAEDLEPAAGWQQQQQQLSVHSVLVDWWLWETGERNMQRHRPHHRVRTVYY